jgi:hypothetical protein
MTANLFSSAPSDEQDIDYIQEENDVLKSADQAEHLVDFETLRPWRDFVQRCENAMQKSEDAHTLHVQASNVSATERQKRLTYRLIVASALGLVDCVRWLLERGADPTVAVTHGRDHWTALHYAAATRHVHVLATLLTTSPRVALVIDSLCDNSPQHYTPFDLLSIDLQQTPREVRQTTCTPHEVWSWGSGTEWLLGHGDPLDRHAPKRIRTLEGEHVVSLATTSRCCAALTVSGTYNAYYESVRASLGTRALLFFVRFSLSWNYQHISIRGTTLRLPSP